MLYLERARRKALAKGEGYGEGHINEPEVFSGERKVNPALAVLPLVLVAVVNKVLTSKIPEWFGDKVSFSPTVVGKSDPVTVAVSSNVAIWAVEGALLIGILTVIAPVSYTHLDVYKRQGSTPRSDR